ncbi:MAG: histidine kinase dimerization/phospho-acceptor domain-containing protein, partial [Verrucomicrobiota bacterium]
MKIKSIEFQLVGWCCVISLSIFLCFGVFSYTRLNHYLDESVKENLVRRGKQVHELLEMGSLDAEKGKIPEEIQNRYAPERNDRFIRIHALNHPVLYSSGEPYEKSFHPDQIPLTEQASPNVQWIKLKEQNISLVALSVFLNEDTYIIEIGTSDLPSKKILLSYLRTLIFAFPVFLLISAAGGYILIRGAFRPVNDIIIAANAITQHNLSQRLPVEKNGDSLERLGTVLNEMIDRLDEAFQHASRFTADASHELRTPLTIIHGELESLLLDTGIHSESYAKIDSILEETERLTKIVEALFAISRLESGEKISERTQFNLSELISSTADQMSLLAVDKNISLILQTEQTIMIEGDRSRIKQAVVNLIDNAIKYSPRDKKIWLETHIEENRAAFKITDQGSGIPEDSLPYVFDR